MALWKKLGSGFSSVIAFKQHGVSNKNVTTSDSPLINQAEQTEDPVRENLVMDDTTISDVESSSEQIAPERSKAQINDGFERVEGQDGDCTELRDNNTDVVKQETLSAIDKQDQVSSKQWKQVGGKIMTVNLLRPKLTQDSKSSTTDNFDCDTETKENMNDPKPGPNNAKECVFAMKEKVLSKKNVISAVNGFKGKKIVGLRDTSDGGESATKPKLKHKSDRKQGKSKRNVSFNPQDSVRVFKKSAELSKNDSSSSLLELRRKVGKDKSANKSDAIRSPSSKEEKQYISSPQAAEFPTQNSKGKTIDLPYKKKINKKGVKKKPLGNINPAVSDKQRRPSIAKKDVRNTKSPDKNSEPAKTDENDPQTIRAGPLSAVRGKRLRKKDKSPEKEVTEKKFESAAKMKWKRMGVIIKLASTLEKGQQPSLLMMTQGGKESVESSLKTSLMIQNYQTLLKPKLGAIPRNGGNEMDRFRQHTQEKRSRGLGEVFIHSIDVNWQGEGCHGDRDPKGICSFVKLPWEEMVREPACLSGASHSFSCLLTACTCSLKAPSTGGLHGTARSFLYTLLGILAPLLAGLLGSYLGCLLFLQVWLLRPLQVALAMQAKLVKDCCQVIMADLFCLPCALLGRVTLATSRAIDLATLASPLSSVFLGKVHSVDWSLPTSCGSGRSSRERYPCQKRARLPFTHKPLKEQVLGRVVKEARRMAAAHREWLAQVGQKPEKYFILNSYLR